jgi:SAM-dependent methyltransferase
MAIPLTTYLSPSGSYEGLDIVRLGIDWCRDQITTRFPNFRFHHADVFNRGYNPAGRADSAAYRLPFQDAEFDFVILTSVFTHMVPIDVQNYLAEVARVLKINGRCVATFYLTNEENERLRTEGKNRFVFSHAGHGYWTTNPRAPEDLTCYAEGDVRTVFDANGLEIIEPVHFGKWSGRTGTLSYQDIVVCRKSVTGKLAYPRISLWRRISNIIRRLTWRPMQKLVWRGATIRQVERAVKAARRQRRAA